MIDLTSGNQMFLEMFKASNHYSSFYELDELLSTKLPSTFYKNLFAKQFSGFITPNLNDIKYREYDEYKLSYVAYNNLNKNLSIQYNNFNFEISYYDEDGSLYNGEYYPMSADYPTDEKNKKTLALNNFSEDDYRLEILKYLSQHSKYNDLYSKYLNALLAGYPREIHFYEEAKPFVQTFEPGENQRYILENYFESLIQRKRNFLNEIQKLSSEHNSLNNSEISFE